MNNQFNICRICLSREDDGELKFIFEKDSKIAYQIFLISGVKIIEFSNFKVPALICNACLNDLSTVVKFRMKCLESESWFSKSVNEIETNIWHKKLESIKNELKGIENQDIKEEPDFNYFENVDTIIEEEEKDTFTLADLLNVKNDNSENEIDIENKSHEKNRRRSRKKPLTYENDNDDSDPNWSLKRNEDGLIECHLCQKNFTSIGSRRDHMRAIHQKLDYADMFKCKFCDRLFKMKYYLNRHLKRSHTCKQKNETERQPKAKSKIKDNNEDDIFKERLTGLNCPYCQKFLTSRHSLNDHIRVKHEYINYSERFLCDVCGKDFPIKYYLLRHIRATHLKTVKHRKKKVDQALPCSICGKVLKSKGNLSQHEKTHRKLTPSEYFYCDLCGNKFKGRGEMTVHIKKRHLYKIRYPCPDCPNKSWKTLFQLQRHIKVIHHNIRDFKCEYCGKMFGEKNKLVCHTRIHTGEQPFQCDWINCNRKFTHQTDYRRHVWGHQGRRPYKCQNLSCGKGFMKRSELTAHENRCHASSTTTTASLQQVVSTTPSLPIQFQYQMM